MKKDRFDRRIFSPPILLGDIAFLASSLPALLAAARNPEIGRAFREKIAIVVSAINGCSYCSWFHAKQAVTSGMSDDEIRNMFNLQFEATASERELPALLYAQHYAETNRSPDPEMTARLEDFYGKKTARDVLLIIRMISFGNLLGNTFDAFLSRLKGRKAQSHSGAKRGRREFL